MTTLIPPILDSGVKMNSWEAPYAGMLEYKLRAGLLIAYTFEPVKFFLAKNTWYKPDFMVIYKDRIEFHEVKGFWRSRDRVRFKATAEQYPWFRWIAAVGKKKRDHIEWTYEYYGGEGTGT